MERQQTNNQEDLSPVMPENFGSVIHDFLSDLSITFPEYTYLWDKWNTVDDALNQELYKYCLTVYPERFFDILYQNDEIFQPNNEVNTCFLPVVDFKMLFAVSDISEVTKKTIWKYLQLIMVTIMTGIKNKDTFGDTMNLFDGVSEEDLQNKLSETISGLSGFFKNMESARGTEMPTFTSSSTDDQPTGDGLPDFKKMFESMNSGVDGETPDFENMFSGADSSGNPFASMPNADDLHSHIKGLFDGKIGKLAKELAEELSGDLMGMFDDDGSGAPKSTQDVLKKMMKDPKKIMDLLKTVGKKLDTKMKNGDISQAEMMKEASEMMSKMKDMGGGKEFQDIMKNLAKGMPGMGKGAKFDMGAMSRMVSQNKNKERMQQKLEQRKQQQQDQLKQSGAVLETTGENKYTFKMENEGVQEKSSAKPPAPAVVLTDDWLDDFNKTNNPTPNTQPKKKGKKGKK